MSTNHAQLPEVMLFTDGACQGNPGPGGWGYILRHVSSGAERRASGAEKRTTNNKMELTAVVEGLQALKVPCRVTVVTDSQYVANGLKTWMAEWKKRGWRRADKGPVLNVDLWQKLDELAARHQLTLQWIRGHAGHPENEECDRLAVAAREALLHGG